MCFSVSGVFAGPGDPGTDGTAGTAGSTQTTTVTNTGDASGTTWGDSGTAGSVGGVGSLGQGGFDAPFAGSVTNPATSGGKGGNGGNGGLSGASGSLNVGVSGSNTFDFTSTNFGAIGITGANGGNGAQGGSGGSSGVSDAFTTQINGANGGNGGNGGIGASGADGGSAGFNFTDGVSTFLANTIFGGNGGSGGVGGIGGKGGIGGNGAPSFEGWYNPMGGITYPDQNAGNGGNGGDGGVGGKGGDGGNGGNAVITIGGVNTVVNFNTVQFGGNGGNGGAGGQGGDRGNRGLAGATTDPNHTSYHGAAGIDGQFGLYGNGGAGGKGGNAGNGSVTINGGVVNLLGTAYFGGQVGAAGIGGAAGGAGAVAGANGAAGNAASGSKLQLDSGVLNLGGDIVFRGTGNTVEINGGTISYDANRKIELTGNVTKFSPAELKRTSGSGVLTINATSITGVSGASKIKLNLLGSGEFLAANVTPTNLTAASFDLSGYRTGALVTVSDNKYSLDLSQVQAITFTWSGGGNNEWQMGASGDTTNWESAPDYFATGDTAIFTTTGAGTVTLVGGISPAETRITSGTYNFAGSGYLANGVVNVESGASLTFSNTAANTHSDTNIASGGTVNVSIGNSLGEGTVTNNGTLQITFATDDTVNNILAGSGTINKEGAGKLTLTGNSTATGGTLNVNTGTLQVGNGSSGSYGGNISSSTDVTFNSDYASTYGGVLSGNGKLVKIGTGALTVAGTATSGVQIDGGTIVVGNVNALGTGADVNSNGTLDVNGFTPTGVAINLNGGALVNNNATAATINTNLTLSADSKIGGSGDLVIGATLTGSYNIEKTGAGITTLTADNTYNGTTTISAGKLKLAGSSGNVGGDILISSGATLSVDRDGDVSNDISGGGNVEISKNVSLTGSTLTYTGDTTVSNATLTGKFSSQSALLLKDNAAYNLGSADRAIKSATIESGSKIDLNGNKLTVNSGGVLTVIATQDKTAAPVQGNGGSLEIAAGATLQANLATDKSAYQLQAGQTTPVYFADGLSAYSDTGAEVKTEPNRLFRVEGALQFDGGSLFFNIKRNFAAELFPLISHQLAPVIDNYGGGNEWVENMMTNESDDDVTGKYVQGGLDLANLSNSMNALYNTQTSIGNILYSRTQRFILRKRTEYVELGQSPCESVACNAISSNREIYIAPIYSNSRGFRLKSGGYKYDYVNDQWGLGFGIDRSFGLVQFGMMGIYGEGKALTRGMTPRTVNDSAFGGLFFYVNSREGDVDLLLSTGYLGMENSIEQATSGSNLTGKITTGLATLSAIFTKTLYYDDAVSIMPTFGIEYGYYHQGSLAARYNNAVVTRVDKAHTNLAVIPIGVKIITECYKFDGQLNPEFRARYIANVGGTNANYNTYLAGSPNSALMATKMTDRNAGDIGLGFSWRNRKGVTIKSDVGYLFSKHYGELTVSANAEWKF
jgi:hypothetical protein